MFTTHVYDTLLTKNKPSETDCDDSRCQVGIESGVKFVHVSHISMELFGDSTFLDRFSYLFHHDRLLA